MTSIKPRPLRVDDPVRTVDKDFQTSVGLVRMGSVGVVTRDYGDGFLRVAIHGPRVDIVVLRRYLDYHRPQPL